MSSSFVTYTPSSLHSLSHGYIIYYYYYTSIMTQKVRKETSELRVLSLHCYFQYSAIQEQHMIVKACISSICIAIELSFKLIESCIRTCTIYCQGMLQNLQNSFIFSYFFVLSDDEVHHQNTADCYERKCMAKAVSSLTSLQVACFLVDSLQLQSQHIREKYTQFSAREQNRINSAVNVFLLIDKCFFLFYTFILDHITYYVICSNSTHIDTSYSCLRTLVHKIAPPTSTKFNFQRT